MDIDTRENILYIPIRLIPYSCEYIIVKDKDIDNLFLLRDELIYEKFFNDGINLSSLKYK